MSAQLRMMLSVICGRPNEQNRHVIMKVHIFPIFYFFIYLWFI